MTVEPVRCKHKALAKTKVVDEMVPRQNSPTTGSKPTYKTAPRCCRKKGLHVGTRSRHVRNTSTLRHRAVMKKSLQSKPPSEMVKRDDYSPAECRRHDTAAVGDVEQHRSRCFKNGLSPYQKSYCHEGKAWLGRSSEDYASVYHGRVAP